MSVAAEVTRADVGAGEDDLGAAYLVYPMRNGRRIGRWIVGRSTDDAYQGEKIAGLAACWCPVRQWSFEGVWWRLREIDDDREIPSFIRDAAERMCRVLEAEYETAYFDKAASLEIRVEDHRQNVIWREHGPTGYERFKDFVSAFHATRHYLQLKRRSALRERVRKATGRGAPELYVSVIWRQYDASGETLELMQERVVLDREDYDVACGLTDNVLRTRLDHELRCAEAAAAQDALWQPALNRLYLGR